jgi:hypothetical protein
MTSDTLRAALANICDAATLTEAHVLAADALSPTPEPPPRPVRKFAEAQTLAGLTTDAWRIVARTADGETVWDIPVDEVKMFKMQRDKGRITSAQRREGDHFLILARLVRAIPAPEPPKPRHISSVWKRF